MGLPTDLEARRYYRAGMQRLDDAQLLLREGRTTGAVYLAGYTAECLLKALLVASVAASRRPDMLRDIRLHGGHNIEWLGALHRRHVRAAIPREVTKHLSRLAGWSPDQRYESGLVSRRHADEFMESVVAIARWADGRM